MDIEELRERTEISNPIIALRNLQLPVELPMNSQDDIRRMDIWLEINKNFIILSLYLSIRVQLLYLIF